MLPNNNLSQFRKPGLSYLPAFFFISLLVTLILFVSTTNVYSAQVTLAWDPPVNDADIAGYKVYYGNSNGNYSSNVDVGNQTSYTITNLVDGNTYFFAVTAYTFYGNESSYSNEVSSGTTVTSLLAVSGAQCGQSSTLSAEVMNTGSSALPSDAKVRFWMTGSGWSGSHWVGETSVAGLGVGETKWYLYDWNIPSDAQAGTYKYWAQVWTTSEAISPWSAREDFSVTGGKAQVVYLGPVTGALSGQSSSLWVDVENTSSSRLPSDAKVRFWMTGSGWSGSHWVGETSVAGLGVGETKWYLYDWNIPSDAQVGTYTYWAQVWTTSEAISSWSTREDFSVQ